MSTVLEMKSGYNVVFTFIYIVNSVVSGEIYTTGKNFTLPQAMIAWTNLTSGRFQLENPCAIHIIVCIQTQLVFSISRKVVEDMERSSKKYRVMRVRNIETCKPLQLDIQAPPTVPRGYIGTRASQNGFLFIASFPRQRKQGKARAVFALGTCG